MNMNKSSEHLFVIFLTVMNKRGRKEEGRLESMSTHRLRRRAKRKRQAFLQKMFLFFITFIIISSLSISLGCDFAAAKDEKNKTPDRHKYYKSIEIKSGDTLWDISLKYMDESYVSIDDYINELMEINGLVSSEIQEGQYLTVCYNSR